MAEFNNYNVAYLENTDVSNGVLKQYVTNGKKTIVMISGNFCHFCSAAKPAFMELSNNKGITCATIKIDGDEQEKVLIEEVKRWNPSYKGIPSYIIFNTDGTLNKVHEGGRSVEDLSKAMM